MNRWNKYYQEHGYYEWKSLGKVRCKCTNNNGNWIGYLEAYDINGNGKIECKQISI